VAGVVDEGTMPNTDAIFTLAVLAEHEEASM
jgi:cytochrome c-type biogenesis protein CcmE